MKIELHQFCKKDFFDFLFQYLVDGWLKDPKIINLNSYSKNALEENNFEHTGNDDEFSMYSTERYFSNKSKKNIGIEFKIYFFQGRFWTNGFEVFSQISLVDVLKNLNNFSDSGKVIIFPFSLYLDERFEDGAIGFKNGTIIRFITSTPTKKSNYYLTAVESNYSSIKELDTKRINLNSVESIFTKHTLIDIKEHIGKSNPALDKLFNFLKNTDSLILE